MTRLSYRLYLWATALHYRLPRRLTKAGLLAAAGMVMAGAIGSDLDQSVAFQGFALLFCMLAVAVARAPFFRGRFVVSRRLPRLASVGQSFHYSIDVRNCLARRYRDLEILEDLADPRPSYAEFAQLMRPAQRMRTFRLASASRPSMDYRRALARPAPLGELGPGGAACAEMELTPLRRGPLRLKGVSVARKDPLGLCRGFVNVALPETVLVLPKRYRLPALNFPGTRHYQPGGVALASSVGDSEEFVSLRDYRPGDALRHIHWRSWARTGRPIVKEYQDEFLVRHGLVLDTFVAPGQAAAFEEAVSVAASFACTLETQESLLDLLFVESKAFCFTTGRGLGESEQMLETLASVSPAREGSFEALRSLVLRHADLLSACICVFVNWDRARAELVRQLRGMGLPLLVLIVADGQTERAVQAQGCNESSVALHILRPGSVAEELQSLEGSEW